jgi:hypothetical protein
MPSTDNEPSNNKVYLWKLKMLLANWKVLLVTSGDEKYQSRPPLSTIIFLFKKSISIIIWTHDSFPPKILKMLLWKYRLCFMIYLKNYWIGLKEKIISYFISYKDINKHTTHTKVPTIISNALCRKKTLRW